MRLDAMRNAAGQLMTRTRLGRDVFARGSPEGVRTIRVRKYTAMIFDLLKAYADQRKRTVKRVHVVPRRTVWSIKEARNRLESLLGERSREWVHLDAFLKQYGAVPGHRPHGAGQLVRCHAGDGARGADRALAGRAVRPHLFAQARGGRGVAARRFESPSLAECVSLSVGAEAAEKEAEEEGERHDPAQADRGAAWGRRRGRRHDDAEMRELTQRGAGARGLARPAAQRRPAAVGRPARAAAHPGGAAVRGLRADGRDLPGAAPQVERRRGGAAGRAQGLLRQPRRQPGQVADKWMFRTAEDLAYLLERHAEEQRRLSKAALETLAIVAYHQPVTRAEIEEIRGVSVSAGTLDVLMEIGWVRPRGRRRAPGRPVTYGTTEEFLVHFGLDPSRTCRASPSSRAPAC